MRLTPGSGRAGRVPAGGVLRRMSPAALLSLALPLGGCEGVLNPMGAVGEAERTLIFTAVGLMLLVVVPVIVLTLWFAWHYRASNTRARYLPDFHHSTAIEITVWAVPCLIIAILGYITFETTHSLDPYRPLTTAEAGVVPDPAAANKPLEVEVVALDWKWLFIYPEQHVATINEVAFPVNRPVDFVITSDTVMNSFFIPQLGTQIYAMAGMKTQLHLIANKPGTYFGQSANFSGDGFSDMHFNAIATATPADFDTWLDHVRASGRALDAGAIAELEKPTIAVPATYFGSVEGNPFQAYIDKFMGKGEAMRDAMHGADAAPAGETMPGMSGHSGMGN
jgi:cytochrome o ubiquinol oxidase subunit II